MQKQQDPVQARKKKREREFSGSLAGKCGHLTQFWSERDVDRKKYTFWANKNHKRERLFALLLLFIIYPSSLLEHRLAK